MDINAEEVIELITRIREGHTRLEAMKDEVVDLENQRDSLDRTITDTEEEIKAAEQEIQILEADLLDLARDDGEDALDNLDTDWPDFMSPPKE